MPVRVVTLVREVGRALPERSTGRALHRGEIVWGHRLHTHICTYTRMNVHVRIYAFDKCSTLYLQQQSHLTRVCVFVCVMTYQVVGHQREARVQVHLIECSFFILLISELTLVVENLKLLRGRAGHLLHFLLNVPERLVVCSSVAFPQKATHTHTHTVIQPHIHVKSHTPIPQPLHISSVSTAITPLSIPVPVPLSTITHTHSSPIHTYSHTTSSSSNTA